MKEDKSEGWYGVTRLGTAGLAQNMQLHRLADSIATSNTELMYSIKIVIIFHPSINSKDKN